MFIIFRRFTVTNYDTTAFLKRPPRILIVIIVLPPQQVVVVGVRSLFTLAVVVSLASLWPFLLIERLVVLGLPN